MRIKYLKSLDSRSKDFNRYIAKNYPEFVSEENPELILVSGGDGALLHAIQKFNHLNIPFFGRAAGTLNFLMNRFENVEETLGALQSGKLPLHYYETNSIKVALLRHAGEEKLLGWAVNEVVIGSHVMGYHHFVVNSQDASLKNFDIKGSGICVSTDLGSTGYNFNLGGPILPLGSNLLAINGVVCNRYLNDILTFQEITVECVASRAPTHVYLDGIRSKMKPALHDSIRLSQGEPIRIAFSDRGDFVQRRIDITSRYRKG